MTDFSISRQSSGSGRTVLEVAGELDLASAAEMQAAGLTALTEPGSSTLVLDVTALTFVDSTGLGTWVGLHNHAHEHDQTLALQGVSENLARVLTIAGLASLFGLDAAGGTDNNGARGG